MTITRSAMIGLLTLCVGLVFPAFGQERPDSAKLIAAQKVAMAKLDSMDGVWQWTAWSLLPSGEKHHLIQTERIGTFLDGSVRVVEGRGYESDGKLGFNAFGVISFDPAKQEYRLHSYAQGNVGDFTLTLTDDGYYWEIPAGPMTIRYTATIKEAVWHEVGDRIMPGKDPVRFFEMNLKRTGDTDWPAAGAVIPE